MLGGFTFKGVHSSVYGVRETPGDRVLSPLKRRSMVEIPGRSGQIIQEDGGYEPRVETISCSYGAQTNVSLQRQVRLIAGWLDGIGELTYDYEPEMHYTAFLSSAPPTVKQLEFATFDLEFTINPPFAYEDPQELIYNISSGEGFIFNVGGTVKTPVKITIQNTGSTPITNIFITKVPTSGG